jgi:hypothetical protein
MKPALDPGSPAQASLPTLQFPLSRSPAVLPDCAARRFAGLSSCPAWLPETSDPKTGHLSGPKPPGVPRPFLGNPLSRPALLTEIPKNSESRVARQEDFSSGASYRLTPRKTEALPIACRRRSDLWSPAALFVPLPTLRGGRDRRPDHLSTMHLDSESRKRNFW